MSRQVVPVAPASGKSQDMPYASNDELSESVRRVLPEHAEDIYRAAYNDAWDEYESPSRRRDDESREATAHRVAWAAVKKRYAKGDDDRWHPLPS